MEGQQNTSAGAARDRGEHGVYNNYYNQAFVVMQYFGYLRRQPDALYLNWLAPGSNRIKSFLL